MKVYVVHCLVLSSLLFSAEYYGGDGTVRVTQGEWVGGDRIDLNIDDSLYYVSSNTGGIRISAVFGAVPNPINSGTGVWSVIFANPTDNPITVTQVDITQPGSLSLFSGVQGVKPVTGWTFVSTYNIRWSGSIIVPPHTAIDFVCNVTGTGAQYADCSLNLTVITNSGNYENNVLSTSSANSLPYTNIAFIDDSLTYAICGGYAGTYHQYQLKLFESSDIAPIDSGTILSIAIPPHFSEVNPLASPDFALPNVSFDSVNGWVLSTASLRSLQLDSAFFNFSAVNPRVGGTSLYPFYVFFGEASAQGILQVLHGPTTGDSGMVDTISLFMICPNPMGRNTYGIWGGMLVNPTLDAVTVTQFEIQGSNNIFNNVAGLKPQTGWSRVNFNCIRWTGNVRVPPRGMAEFLCRIKGNNKNAYDVPISFVAFTDHGNSTAFGQTNQGRSGVPYASLYYLAGGIESGIVHGITSSSMKTFTVRVAGSGRAAIPAGTALSIAVPPKWSDVTANLSQSGFDAPVTVGDSATGWSVSTVTNVSLMNAYRDFAFRARAPSAAIDAHYVMPTYLVNPTTNPHINSTCEAVAGVLNRHGGVKIEHAAPGFLEPAYSISRIDVDLVSRASMREHGFLSIYDFSNSQWENLASVLIDTNETYMSGSVRSNLNRYLNGANQIVVLNATTDQMDHTVSEDFLRYRVYDYRVDGIDLAPSVINRGQDSVVMMRLRFSCGSGVYGIDTLRIHLAGTAADGDISAVQLFDDLNHNSILDPGEPQVGPAEMFNLGSATFVGSPLFTFAAMSPRSILIAYTISNTAVLGNYVGVDIMDSDIVTSANLPVPGNYPISSSLSRVTMGAPFIHWSCATPDSIAPDSIEIATLFAFVTDPDGPGDIQRVRVNCEPVNGDSVVILYDDGTHGDQVPLDSIFTHDSIRVMPGVVPGDYYLEVEAMDLADTCSRSLLHVFVRDIYPPLFNTQIWNDTTFGGPFSVQSVITDFSGIAIDSLYFRVNQGACYACTRDSIAGGVLYYTIPQQNANDTIYYYLAAVDGLGNRGVDPSSAPDSQFSFIIIPVGVNEHSIGGKYIGLNVYPNPGKSIIHMYLSSEFDATARLEIYDVAGRLVRSFGQFGISPSANVVWDGTDNENRKTSSGIYFVLCKLRHNSDKKEERRVLKIVYMP
jgi:hypothetical protein